MSCQTPSRDGQGVGLRESSRAMAWFWGCLVLAVPLPAGGQTTREPQTWMALGLGGGGAMYTPAISPADPKLMLLGCDMSGAYRSADGGRTWELIHYAQLTGSTR